jgi:hypothetical protein
MLFVGTPPYDEVDFEVEGYEEEWRSGDENLISPVCPVTWRWRYRVVMKFPLDLTPESVLPAPSSPTPV